MKVLFNKMLVLTLCATLAIVVNFGAKDANSKIITNVPSDVTGSETRAIVVADFEDSKMASTSEEDGWLVTSSPKQYKKASDSETLKKKNPVMVLDMKTINGSSRDMKPEKMSVTKLGLKNEKILGVKFRFRYPGKNSVHIQPPKEVDWEKRTPVMTYDQVLRKDVQERGIQLPGRAKAISLWVHGRGHPYTLELWVKDYRGDVHILDKQTVDFVGWRPLTFNIPNNIPQAASTYPVTRTAKLVRMVLREVTNVSGVHSATSRRKATDAYVFFDQIKVLTDTYEVSFDGQDLHDQFDNGSKGNNTNTK